MLESASEAELDDEVYVSKRKVDEYENKIINQKKIIKSLQNEIEVLKSKNASLETDNNTLKEKLNRDWNRRKFMYRNDQEPSSIHKNKEKEVIFGSISFPENPFLTISRRPKNSLFVKDLVSLLWSDEDLSHRSLTGKKHYNSKEIKQPLTPEKRFAIEEAFKDKLKKQQYHDTTIALELNLVKRYIAEKINDVRKCNSRRNLNMTYDIQNMIFPREEEKDLSEKEPISYDMID
ncbi:BEN domain-containing protein 5 [Armadillidium vulgare]|nr:BEN domain-containing protein 5 [Armadillidium vulgare]